VKFFDEQVAQKLITEVQVTMLKGRRVDMRTADLKMPDKIASINRQVKEDPPKPAAKSEGTKMIPPSMNPLLAPNQDQLFGGLNKF